MKKPYKILEEKYISIYQEDKAAAGLDIVSDIFSNTSEKKIFFLSVRETDYEPNIREGYTSADYILKVVYNPKAFEYYNQWTENMPNFEEFLIKISSGEVIPIMGLWYTKYYGLDEEKVKAFAAAENPRYRDYLDQLRYK